MFPIHSISGRFDSFRWPYPEKDKNVPKYVVVKIAKYTKSDAVYGIFFAKSAIAKEKVLFGGGISRVISMHQAGITNVVAPCGTALTAGQIRLMKRFHPITIIYDNDEAGINASLKNINLLLEGHECSGAAAARVKIPTALQWPIRR